MTGRELRERFRERFGLEPRVFRAPGRVNLIGDHTDYSDGFVLPAAIHLAAWVAVAARTEPAILAISQNLADEYAFSIGNGDARRRGAWTDYVEGVAVTLGKAGFPITGGVLLIDSEVPIGAGLSSSASLEVAVASALLANSGQAAEPLELALLCQRAENEFAGMRCGIMDQFTACFGRRGSALLLDCRTLGHWLVPLPSGVRIVVCNTMVRHTLAGSEYNRRREDCETAARLLGVKALRDVSAADLARRAADLPEQLARRARHVVTENARVRQAADALRRGDCTAFGSLMNESHTSLRDDFEVSCAELDLMAELARRQPGVYGARMTGGGFGGSVVSLVEDQHVNRFLDEVTAGYRASTGIAPDLTICHAAAGAEEVLG